MPHTLLVAPAGRQVGLTTACLGLVRALDREGVRVAFVKPITSRGEDRAAVLMKLGANLSPPEPISRTVADELLSAGDDQTLMEKVVELCARAAEGADVLVVEGLWPEAGMVHSTRVNALMLRALDAELVLVATPHGESPAELASSIAIATHGYGNQGKKTSVILNNVPGGKDEAAAPELEPWRAALEAEHLRPVAVVPSRWELAAPRVKDLGNAIGARVVNAGDADRRRIRKVAIAAMTLPNAMRAFTPGTLLITPGDRGDVLAAAALAFVSGTPLAGLLLTGGLDPDPRILALCSEAFAKGLPVLAVDQDSYPAANAVAAMSPAVPADDRERVELVMTTVADRVDSEWLKGLRPGRTKRLSPPAFRHRLVESARAANKRIVLPEGTEPRTIAAASIVEARGIARCVLLGNPDEIREAFEREIFAVQRNQHGVSRDESVERQQAERGRAVDEDVVVRVAQRADELPEAFFAAGERDHFDFRACQVPVRWQEREPFDARGNDEALRIRRGSGRQGFVDRASRC